jgi:hypothetical protein
MHICGQPDDVAHFVLLDRRQQRCDLQLAPEGHAGIAVGDGLDVHEPVRYDEPDGHVGGNDLPDCRRLAECLFDPRQLLGADDRGVATSALQTRRVRAVEHEHSTSGP